MITLWAERSVCLASAWIRARSFGGRRMVVVADMGTSGRSWLATNVAHGAPRTNSRQPCAGGIHTWKVAVWENLWHNYVMRSTRHVDRTPSHQVLGHYSDPPLLVLASLASGPKHGHAMIDDIVALCGTRLGPGTLYGAIARLEDQGWIEPLPEQERRRPYRITPQGARVLRAKLTTLQQFTKAGIRRLGTT